MRSGRDLQQMLYLVANALVKAEIRMSTMWSSGFIYLWTVLVTWIFEIDLLAIVTTDSYHCLINNSWLSSCLACTSGVALVKASLLDSQKEEDDE